MKKIIIIAVLLLSTLPACGKEEPYTYWTDVTDNQLERLENADIQYEIRNGEIWVREKDMYKVVACCA